MKFWEITRKDLKLLWRDKRTAFILLALPMIFITVIGLTFGQLLGWKNANQLYKIAVYDGVNHSGYPSPGAEVEAETRVANVPVNSAWSYNIVAEFVERIDREGGVVVTQVGSEDEATAMVDDGKANASLVIGEDFIEKIAGLQLADIKPDEQGGTAGERLEKLDLRLHTEDSESTAQTVLTALVLQATQQTVVPLVLCSIDSGDIDAPDVPTARRVVQKLEEEFGCDAVRAEAERPMKEGWDLDPETQQASKRDIYRVLVPGYTVLFVFFLVNIMGHSFIHERDLGTLRRLRIAPISGPALLMGKTIPFFFVSLAQTAILFGFGRWPLGMSVGDEPWLLVPIAVSTSLAATCLGLLIATLVRTESQVAVFANFVVILAGAISGCFMPREWLPEPMQNISLATPHAWALEAYGEALRKATPDVEAVFQSCGVLVGFAAVYFLVGAWQFSRIE